MNPVVAGLGGAALVWAAMRQARTATNRHYEQTRADQQRRLTESFSKAVEQLASDKIEARLGGIYTLERLAIEAIAQVRALPWWRRLLLRSLGGPERLERVAVTVGLRSLPWPQRFLVQLLGRKRLPPPDPISDLYWTVMETLTAFVRERAKWQPSLAAEGGADTSGHVWVSDAASPPSPPWEATSKAESYFGGMEEAIRPSALATDIQAVMDVIGRRPAAGRERERQRRWHVDLRATDLRGAALGGAHLERALLAQAHLEGALLFGVHLEDANLTTAHLQGAKLLEVHLDRANLLRAHLEGAIFFAEVQLADAIVVDAHSERANLSGAEGLRQAQLKDVFGDADTKHPKGLTRPSHWK